MLTQTREETQKKRGVLATEENRFPQIDTEGNPEKEGRTFGRTTAKRAGGPCGKPEKDGGLQRNKTASPNCLSFLYRVDISGKAEAAAWRLVDDGTQGHSRFFQVKPETVRVAVSRALLDGKAKRSMAELYN